MTASVLRSAETGWPGSLWWLPRGGQDNGLDDDAWAPILEISEAAVPAVLAELQVASVPAYAAPVDRAGRPPRKAAERPGWKLWVGASAYGWAEAVLLAVMPHLARELNSRRERAWR